MEQISLLPVREFPDCFVPRNGTKWLLESPENVFGLLQILSDSIASRLDYSRLQEQKTSFVLDSLRKQESDLLFLAPFKDITCEMSREILIYILIEIAPIRAGNVDGVSAAVLHDTRLGQATTGMGT